MPRVLVPLARGFEEIEAVTVIDVLRRAGLEVVVAALAGDAVEGAHGIRIEADRSLAAVTAADFDAIVLPGGQPGTTHLGADQRVRELVQTLAAAGKIVAAICAAPTVLDAAGVLAGKRATAFPGEELPTADYSFDRVVEDGNVITSRAAGTAMEFALTLVRRLVDHQAATDVRQRMLVKT
jgi:4-methyl-5(b-hydroxyethyl)-thiazole monophosphate biosynthesis